MGNIVFQKESVELFHEKTSQTLFLFHKEKM